MRRVGDALVDLGGDLVDGAFALREQVDDLCPASAGKRLGHLGESVEECVLGSAELGAWHIIPNVESVIRLIGALLVEVNDEMIAFDRRYIAAGSLDPLRDETTLWLHFPQHPRN